MSDGSTIMAMSLAAAACQNSPGYAGQPQGFAPQQTAQVQQTQQQNFLLDSSAFDLETVTGMIRTNQVQNAQQLEQLINSRPGINNVDIDGDGQIDYIGVQETMSGNNRQFSFVACPSSQNGNNVTIARSSADTFFTSTGGNTSITVLAGVSYMLQADTTNSRWVAL